MSVQGVLPSVPLRLRSKSFTVLAWTPLPTSRYSGCGHTSRPSLSRFLWPESRVHLTTPVHFPKCSKRCLLRAAPALRAAAPSGLSSVAQGRLLPAGRQPRTPLPNSVCSQVGSLKLAAVEVHTMGKADATNQALVRACWVPHCG